MLNCPFCGSEKIKVEQRGFHIFVICENCMARGPHHLIEDTARNLWNNRTNVHKFVENGPNKSN